MTAVFGNGIDLSFEAGSNMDDYQYHWVGTMGTTAAVVGRVYIVGGGSNPGPLGVLQNDPRSGAEAKVRMMGSTQLRVNAAGSTIHFGRLLTCASDSHGELFNYIPITTGSAVVCHAISLGYTTSDGAIIEAFVMPWSVMESGS